VLVRQIIEAAPYAADIPTVELLHSPVATVNVPPGASPSYSVWPLAPGNAGAGPRSRRRSGFATVDTLTAT
jgi:hypothetical protein